jgi:hypothetical protein
VIYVDTSVALAHLVAALHLASLEFLRQRQQQVELASYDERLIAGASRHEDPQKQA